MLSQFRKILYVLMILFYVHSSYSYELCSIEGDFVPWPWSEQYYGRVLDQNWVMVNSKGTPTSNIHIGKSNFLWGLAGPYYTLRETDLNGNVISWGVANENIRNLSDGSIKFNVYKVEDANQIMSYNVQIGHWKSPYSTLSLEESENAESSPFYPINYNGIYKDCSSFKEERDSIIGIILDKQRLNNRISSEVERYYGLTEQPIYTNEDL